MVKNAGWLPTNVTQKAIERKAVRPVEVTVELPDGASARDRATVRRGRPAAGHARGPGTMLAMFDGGFDPTVERATADWVVHAPGRHRCCRSSRASPHAPPATRRTEVTPSHQRTEA